MERIFITQTSAVCNLGQNIHEIFKNAVEGKICPHKINFALPEIDDADYNIRCNQILLHCLKDLQVEGLIQKYGKKRIGIVIGTTNSGIEEFETSKNIKHAQFGNPAEFLRRHLGLEGFYASVSTACTSGVKTISTAIKLLRSNICDAVIAGGAEPYASLPEKGFKALEVLSDELSLPMSKNRKGMNIGEAGALFVIEKAAEGVEVLGIGETSDAYHAATPEPEAVQAINAINIALNQAGLKPEDIDYINLHGTGTVANDAAEAFAINKVFGENVYASSTKPLTGHCLGAAAAIEIALCCEMLLQNPEKQLLPHIYDGEYDSALSKIKLVPKNTKAERLNICMSESFGFGGTNAVIILGKPKYNLEKILPHNHPMIFIDNIIEVNLDKHYAVTEVTIHKGKIMFENDGMSYLAGIEFMAQTIGCYAYFKNRQQEPKIGYLLGTRSYKNNIEKFEQGKIYTIKAIEVYCDNELVSFECFIYNDNVECARALVNAYQGG